MQGHYIHSAIIFSALRNVLEFWHKYNAKAITELVLSLVILRNGFEELCWWSRSLWQGLPGRTGQEWIHRKRKTPLSFRLGDEHRVDIRIP